MRPRTLRAGTAGSLRLPCLDEFSIDGALERKFVVVHPLWRLDAASIAALGIAPAGVPVRFVDTFDLERRPLNALRFATTRPEDPPIENHVLVPA